MRHGFNCIIYIYLRFIEKCNWVKTWVVHGFSKVEGAKSMYLSWFWGTQKALLQAIRGIS